MTESEAPVEVVDCVGMQCPLPVIKIAQAMKGRDPGQLLELLATDPGVEPDMQAWTRRTKNELVGINKDGDVFHVLVRKGG
ncbi:MAG: sulfurtransferase TusA family protein [Acidimicrobiia bacterium]|jgi:tRNA 2-thiouridine synthesizing protein A|nr:sulfurtransferase TusA family protein [Acidimicrobiia bacterium]